MADGIVSSPLDPGLGQVVLPDTAAQDGSLSAVTRLAEGLMQEAR
ncbi:MAG: hypothetical protein QOF81_2809, partial [Acidimicrobiaceae bacterium]|nr:hypothetical protein [Acidimicrobiaceae bacterium]